MTTRPATSVAPEFGVVARKLAEIADLLPGDDNRHRQALRDVVTALAQPVPGLQDALRHAAMAYFDLSGGGVLVDKPESWLLSAVMVCLQHEKVRLANGVPRAAQGNFLQ